MTYPPIIWILFSTGLIGVFLLIFEKKSRRIEGSYRMFPKTVWALLLWIFANALEIGLTSKNLMILAANVQFIGIGSLPYLLHQTMRQFMGRPLLRRRFMLIAAVIPIVTVFLAFTDPVLGLFRNSTTVIQESGMVQLDIQYGFWHNAIFVPYQYLFYFATLFLLLDSAIKAPKVFRARLIIFAAVIVLPMIGATLYILNISPFSTFNPTPVLIMVSFIVFGAVMMRHHNLDVVPVARERVLDTLDEAVLVLDLDDRIVEFNQAASCLFWELNSSVIGIDFVSTLGKYDALLMLARGVEDSDAGFSLDVSGTTRHCLGKAAPVIGFDGSRIGRVISITDITDRRSPPDTVLPEENTEALPIPSRKTFFRDLTIELERAAKFRRPIHVLAFILPESNEGESISDLDKALKKLLRPWEKREYVGSGRFCAFVPETDKDQALLRARDLLQRLIQHHPALKIGIVCPAHDYQESSRELCSRALTLTRDSVKNLVYQAG